MTARALRGGSLFFQGEHSSAAVVVVVAILAVYELTLLY